MNGLPYYKAYPRDFVEGTIGMRFELKAAYRLILDMIYMQGGRLPDDARYVSGLLGCSVRAWKKYRDELISLGKIQAENGVISNFRADKELETLAKLQDKQRENASGPRKNKGLQKPRPDHTEPEPKERDKSLSTRVTRFDEFWNVYPHRGGVKRNRKGSLQKYTAAVKRGVDEETLIEAAKVYAKDRRVIEGYARDPVTWLNQEGWTDEPAPSQQNGGYDPQQDKWDYIAKHGSSAGWRAANA